MEFFNWAQRFGIRIVRFWVRGFSEGKSDASKTALTLDQALNYALFLYNVSARCLIFLTGVVF